MITVYTFPRTSSSKKVRDWFTSRELEFKEINLMTSKFTPAEFIHLLFMTEIGVDDILSKRSRAYQNLILSTDIESLSINELMEKINDDRTILKTPLIVTDKHLQIGYNSEDIRQFIPRSMRKNKLDKASENLRNTLLDKIRESA